MDKKEDGKKHMENEQTSRIFKESIPDSLENFQLAELEKSDVEKIKGILYYLRDKEYDASAEDAQEKACRAVFAAHGGRYTKPYQEEHFERCEGEGKSTDPLEFFTNEDFQSYCYAKFYGTKVDWILRDVFHCEPICRTVPKENDNWYQKNGMYYVAWGDGGYLNSEIQFESIQSDGRDYYITYKWDKDIEENTGEYEYGYALLRKHTADRKSPYWSILKLSKQPILA